MRKLLSIVLLLSCVQVSHARFSKFVHVTPSTEKECKLNVSVTPGDENLYSIKFPWESQSKKCWLIVFENSEALPENIDLRQIIWSRGESTPKGVSQIIPLRENQDGYIEVVIKKEVMARSHISIDFPYGILDGGYYYTVDLPAYLKALEK